MADYEFSISFERTSPDDHRSAERLQREVWDVLMDVFSQYLMDEGEVWPYLREVTVGGLREGWWTADDDQLRYAFPTLDGTRIRSAAAFAHWSRLAAALRWPTLQKVAGHSDASFVERRSVAELLEEPAESFVTHNGSTWLIDASDGTPRLVGDGSEIELNEAGEKARDAVAAVLERGQCGCRMCTRLRPDPAQEAQWRQALQNGDRTDAERATKFLLNTVAPSTKAIVTLAGAADYASSYRHTRAMFELGKRLDPNRLDDLRDAIGGTEDPGTRAALLACVAGLAAAPKERSAVLMEHFDAEPPAAETAVEFLGYGELPSEMHLELAERLAECVGQRDDLDYAIALTLYNVFREEDYPPGVVKEALERLSRTSGEQADVARRALAWFNR